MDWQSLQYPKALSLPQRLSIQLEKLILSNELKPGDRLPSERELADLFNVSRASIRDGLKALEEHGLIDRKPGRGTIVVDKKSSSPILGFPDSSIQQLGAELRDIIQLRLILEPPIARIAAEQATPRDHEQLRELVEEMERDSNAERYAELDSAFHQAIANYTHNSLLSLLNEQISQQIQPIRSERFQTRKRRETSTASHRKIFEAIASRDGEKAEIEALQHVVNISEQVAGVATRLK